ncbi:MAG: hypothetical protein WBY94_23910 [Polyangiaceae bacterium]
MKDDQSVALLAPSAIGAPNAWDDVRLQRLWLAAERRGWRSLAVVGASNTTDTLPIAALFAQLSWRYRGQPSVVCDLRDLSMRLIDYHIREVHEHVDSGARVVIALRSVFENPTSAPVARDADAVVLCVSLGKTSFRSAEQTIKEIGRERILGSIILGANPRNGSPQKAVR